METLPTLAQAATLFHWRHGAEQAGVRVPRLKERPPCGAQQVSPWRRAVMAPPTILISVFFLNPSRPVALRTHPNSLGSRGGHTKGLVERGWAQSQANQ